MVCACSLQAQLRGGDGSRTELDLEKLKDAGWSVEKKGKSYAFVSPSAEGKKFKSSKDVEVFLQEGDDYHLFVRCKCGAVASDRRPDDSELDSDEEYYPDTEEEAGVSSAYDDTPVKAEKPGQAALEPMAKRLEHVGLYRAIVLISNQS